MNHRAGLIVHHVIHGQCLGICRVGVSVLRSVHYLCLGCRLYVPCAICIVITRVCCRNRDVFQISGNLRPGSILILLRKHIALINGRHAALKGSVHYLVAHCRLILVRCLVLVCIQGVYQRDLHITLYGSAYRIAALADEFVRLTFILDCSMDLLTQVVCVVVAYVLRVRLVNHRAGLIIHHVIHGQCLGVCRERSSDHHMPCWHCEIFMIPTAKCVSICRCVSCHFYCSTILVSRILR